MKGIILSLMVLFSTASLFAQIVVGETEPTKKTEEKVKVKEARTTDGSTSLYFVTNWSNTNRTLVLTDEFSDSLGTRADESSLNTWSFGLGMQNKLNDHLMWDGGICFVRNGESYNFTGTDTSFSYQTYYNYIGMPVRINYTYGKDFKFYAGAGFLPQMFTGYRQERQWTTTTDSKDTETIKTKSGYNPFVISAIFNIGLVMNFQNNWALVVSPEARIQLNSSYEKLDDYVHKSRAYGITFGLIRNL